MKSKLRLHAVAHTDIGLRYEQNEDSVLCQLAEQGTAALLVVADGMGGHVAGEQASQMVIERVARAMSDWLKQEEVEASEQVVEEIEKGLYTAVQQANQTVFNYAQENLANGANMGSTIACAFVHQATAYIANVGDSRVYLHRQGKLHRITEDHSLVERFVQEGIIADHGRYEHPARNVVTRAIGPRPDVTIDLFACDLEVGDYLLLCSDGLWEMLRGDEVIAHHLQQSSDLNQIGQNLIKAANDAGGDDNISVILAQCLPG